MYRILAAGKYALSVVIHEELIAGAKCGAANGAPAQPRLVVKIGAWYGDAIAGAKYWAWTAKIKAAKANKTI